MITHVDTKTQNSSPKPNHNSSINRGKTLSIRSHAVNRNYINHDSTLSPLNSPLIGRRKTKLKIGDSNSQFEREADSVSAKIMNISAHSPLNQSTPFSSKVVESDMATPGHELNCSGGCALSDETRQYMEPRFCVDFSGVIVHKNDAAQRTASKLNARAFTYGNHIWLGKGTGEKDKGLMAHELTHVVQQSTVNTDGVIERSDELNISVDGSNNTNSLVAQRTPTLQIQRLQSFPEPTSITVTKNHQIPIAANHVVRGWRSGFGGVSEMKLNYNNPNNPQSVSYAGAKIKENFVRGSGNNASIGGCSNTHGQGGAGGSTFTVGNSVSFSQNGLAINLPSKSNTFYDMHIKGFGTNILPAGINSQTSLCVQEYTYDGSVIGNTEFERHHNITRGAVGGQDVATIDLSKFGSSVLSP